MSRYVFKLPDLGEGTVEAELMEWHVKPGATVKEDDVIADVMTDKANVEIPSPVSGTVVATTGQPGDMIAVGSDLIIFETSDDGESAAEPAEKEPQPAAPQIEEPAVASAPQEQSAAVTADVTASATATGRRPLTSPAVRRLARETGVDLAAVAGSGPRGRILKADLENYLTRGPVAQSKPATRQLATGSDEIKVIGVRRVIAQRMTDSKRNIPHFAYVEEIDVTELEALRKHLNGQAPAGAPSLTYLPFLVLALNRALRDFPQCNATYDSERNVIIRHHGVHVGIATQTDNGLMVPVVRHAEARDLYDIANEISRVSSAARDGKASKEELKGSTITITSLGKMGGIVTTPVINAPEVSIIGVNKAVDRPVVVNGAIAVRRIMNLSSSFDHRFVDGYDAAAMIQQMKSLLEHPATIFMP
ncbi:MAG: dihydrolipoamide acetyltransferase family protein [Chromatiales bacterium]|jgi:2-oxoisovalerate dehydrogenase E2 component (dihydrolipoyl transacylase)